MDKIRMEWPSRAAQIGAAIALALAAAPAGATPGSGFAPSPVSSGQFGELDVKAEKAKDTKWDMLLKTKDATDVAVDKLTVQPGGYSGWHAHPAPIFVTVMTGTIQWYDGTDPICGWRTYSAGQSFIEPAYRPHLVRNATTSVAEFHAVRIAPTGVPVRLDRPEPTNC